MPPPPAGTIGGFLFGDQNRNGIFDDGESRLGNVPVTLTPAGSPTPTRTVTAHLAKSSESSGGGEFR